MNKRLAPAVGLATLMLAGCETIMPENRHPLIDKEWHLAEIQRPSQPVVSIPRNQQLTHTMTLSSNGTAAYQLDCNRGNGTWQGERPVNNVGTITIGDIAATRALCPSPSYGEELAGALPLATGYFVSPNGMRLELRSRLGTYVFTTR